jgi:hypothetical protein
MSDLFTLAVKAVLFLSGMMCDGGTEYGPSSLRMTLKTSAERQDKIADNKIGNVRSAQRSRRFRVKHINSGPLVTNLTTATFVRLVTKLNTLTIRSKTNGNFCNRGDHGSNGNHRNHLSTGNSGNKHQHGNAANQFGHERVPDIM